MNLSLNDPERFLWIKPKQQTIIFAFFVYLFLMIVLHNSIETNDFKYIFLSHRGKPKRYYKYWSDKAQE